MRCQRCQGYQIKIGKGPRNESRLTWRDIIRLPRSSNFAQPGLGKLILAFMCRNQCRTRMSFSLRRSFMNGLGTCFARFVQLHCSLSPSDTHACVPITSCRLRSRVRRIVQRDIAFSVCLYQLSDGLHGCLMTPVPKGQPLFPRRGKREAMLLTQSPRSH